MDQLKKKSPYLRNLYEHYIGKQKIKNQYNSSDKALNYQVPYKKVTKRYVNRKKSSQLLKYRSSLSKNSGKQSLTKQNHQSETVKTIKQRNLKRWKSEFNAVQYKSQEQRFRTTTTNKPFKNPKTGRRLTKVTTQQIKNQLSFQKTTINQQIFQRAKNILIQYQKRLSICEGQKHILKNQNKKLKQILTQYMNLK